MRRSDRLLACILAVLWPGGLFAQESDPAPRPRYSPPSGYFTCDLPGPGW